MKADLAGIRTYSNVEWPENLKEEESYMSGFADSLLRKTRTESEARGEARGKAEGKTEEMQANIYKKALDYRNSKITAVDTYDEFKEKIEEGGFILAHWDGTTETEEKIKEETKATIRCIPFDSFVPGDKEPGKCMVTGKPSACRVIFARSY